MEAPIPNLDPIDPPWLRAFKYLLEAVLLAAFFGGLFWLLVHRT